MAIIRNLELVVKTLPESSMCLRLDVFMANLKVAAKENASGQTFGWQNGNHNHMISHFTTLVLSSSTTNNTNSSLTRSHQVSNLNATISKYDLQILDATLMPPEKKKRTELTKGALRVKK